MTAVSTGRKTTMSDYTPGNGCCTTCNGTGASCDPETSGLCWDCRGTGHAHYGPCEQEALASAWPILSAPLRELADEWVQRNPDEWHRSGAQRGIEASREAHARELLQELDRIDQELGIGGGS